MEYCLFSLFVQSVNRHSSKVACQAKEGPEYKVYTYAQIYETSLRVATFLSQQDLAFQDRVAIILENCPFWPAIYFGIIGLRCVAVPIDPKLTPQEIINIIRDSQAKLLFTSPELYLPIKNLLANILNFRKAVFYPFSEINQAKADQEKIIINSPDNLASILYTSGTTAVPKGVMLTHKNFSSNFESIKKTGLIRQQDNVISLLPLHHSYPFMVTLIAPLLSGAQITYPPSLKSAELIRCIRETKVSILVGVPQLFHILHKAIKEKVEGISFLIPFLWTADIARKYLRINLNKIILKKLHRNFGPAMRFFVSGGARLPPQVAKELTLFGFNIVEGYGLTETSPVVTFTPLGRLKVGSVGLPVEGVKIKINNPDQDNTGEVLIQGDNVMRGYYKRPKETASVLKDGWFYSGDLGLIDKEGYL